MTHPRIVGNVRREDFVGRDAQLRQLIGYSSEVDARKLLVLAAPGVGGSEFLRQSYDELFFRRGYSIPIYFAFGKDDEPAAKTAVNFFQTFLQQYIAYRRVDPSLCNATLTLHELTELALPTDYEAVTRIVESFERERSAEDDTSFVRFCLAAPRKLAADVKRSLVPLIDCIALPNLIGQAGLVDEVVKSFLRRNERVVVGGLRRHMTALTRLAGVEFDDRQVIHLEKLDDEDADRLVDSLTRHLNIQSNEQTRDLIVQEAHGSPFFIAALIQAARDTQTPVNNFLNCQRLYVDELMGGRINQHCSSIFSQIAPQAQTRKTLLRLLYESGMSDGSKSSVWSWKKRLGVDATEFERIVDALHINELVNSSGSVVEVNREASVWMDYLHAHYRIEVAGESRALAVANTLIETLKRAPQAMARKYRRAAAIGLPELLSQFNCQSIPASLLHYDRFAAAHKGVDMDSVNAELDAEADLIRLPQIVQVADGTALSTSVEIEEKRSAIAHGFEAADYTDENEVVWITAQIDSKLEAEVDLTSEWCDRLAHIARECNFTNIRVWLVSPEGFSPEASAVLNERGLYSSSRRQIELLTARLEPQAEQETATPADEYEMVIPMSEDTELIAAHTVEQIARRVNFRPDAINQIKLALVEACINAAEHSLSPDRKIYQRFRVENDKLVVTVASRGVVPANIPGQNGGLSGNGKSRRGWGLKLIRSLMDEVEFERVDDGTQLRMTKYLK